jgi:N-succinyldiaminopimelate aminotransferase
MNPLLSSLQPYPFERLKKLFASVTPNPAYQPISLGIGEPKHATPQLIKDALTSNLQGLAGYPATAGEPALREACAAWLGRRYGLSVDAKTQVLPVNGSREALFSLTQTIIDPSQAGATVISPNPFYQIYEGAALLAGAQLHYVASDPARNFAVDWDSVSDAVWRKTQLIFVCSPGNPTGAVMQLAEWQKLFALSDKYGFVIASDECYSEIYFRDEPPLGGLEAAVKLGRADFKNLIALTSLSKRSNVPGMRSGFVAGDAAIIAQFLLYRTYHGSAMSGTVQAASIAAWNDEQHVVDNRAMYREKFAAVTPLLAQVLIVKLPDAAFYLWAKIPANVCGGSDTAFAAQLLSDFNVTVLPGSYLARNVQAGPASAGYVRMAHMIARANASHSGNPGAGYIRMALVAETAECVEAAQRIVRFVQAQLAQGAASPVAATATV